MRLLVAVALLASALVSSVAHAGPPGSVAAAPTGERVVTRHYGWQIVGLDVASIAVAAAWVDHPGRAGAAASAYVLTGPLVHLAHGHRGRALGSLAFRVAVPLGGALLAAACGESSSTCPGAVTIGALGAFIVGETIDAVRATDVTRTKLPIAPAVSASESGVQLGVMGHF